MDFKKFTLESSTLNYDIIFEGGNFSVHFLRKLGECRLDQVTKVEQKKSAMSGGDETSFRVYYLKDGVEKKFPWIQARVTSPATKECLDYMKAVFPPTVEWIERRKEVQVDETGRKKYDLQCLPFGYAGAGLPRALQLWIYFIFLSVLIVPFFYYLVVLAKGGYRIYTSDNGIEIRKAGAKKMTWSDIERFNFTDVNVYDPNSFSSTHVLKLVAISKSGRSTSAVMRFDHALPLMKELAERGLVSEELVRKYA